MGKRRAYRAVSAFGGPGGQCAGLAPPGYTTADPAFDHYTVSGGWLAYNIVLPATTSTSTAESLSAVIQKRLRTQQALSGRSPRRWPTPAAWTRLTPASRRAAVEDAAVLIAPRCMHVFHSWFSMQNKQGYDTQD